MNKDEAGDDRVLANGEAAKVEFGKLLRMAAGTTTADYVFAEEVGRELIHDRGRAALVSAAGRTMSEYVALPPNSKARSDILLRGAEVLGIETRWEGWA
jgi:hypothetical protein